MRKFEYEREDGNTCDELKPCQDIESKPGLKAGRSHDGSLDIR